MGTTLTGTTPQDTYDSLIKVTDNGPISGTLKALSDGLGNDSTLSLSTTAASIAGTLAVAGNATFDTNTLFVDAANNRVGIGTVVPAGNLHIASATDGGIRIQGGASGLSYIDLADTASGTPAGSIAYNHIADALQFATGGSNAERMRIDSAGNVGIGITAPTEKLHISNTASASAFKASNSVGGFVQLGVTSSATSEGTMSFTNKLSISGGVISISDGIQFPATQVASANANTLDDYEEGTWTMGVTFNNAAVGMTTATNTGTYTKIGRQVTINGYFSLTNKGTSIGTASITGLPFTIGSSTGNYSAATFWVGQLTFNTQFFGILDISTTSISLWQVLGTTGIRSAITNTDFSNTTDIVLSATYFV
jgi:hypothetical protein